MTAARLDSTACPTPFWLPGGHLQTIYSAYCTRHQRIAFVRQRAKTADDDFIDFDWTGPGLFPERLHTGELVKTDVQLRHTAARRWGAPQDWAQLPNDKDTRALLLLHGLEGSSKSHYAQAIAQYFRARGWVVVIAHFRGCSGFPNRMARAYYSGDSTDIDFMLRTAHTLLPNVQWHAAGVSMGGNALLKYLGEQGKQANWLHGCAAISAPLDLVACGEQISNSFSGRYLYNPHFLRSMKAKILAKTHRYPGLVDFMRLNQARTLRDFDDLYTAPMHGYVNAHDYWRQCAAKPLLKDIRIPTLILNARNDPFIPVYSLPQPRECSDTILLHQPKTGGHVGFTTGHFPGHYHWLPRRIAQFFNSYND